MANNLKRRPRKKFRKPMYGAENREKIRDQMYQLMAEAKTDAQREAIAKAYDVTVFPYR